MTEQKAPGALDRLENLEKEGGYLREQLANAINTNQALIDKLMRMEQGMAGLAKTMAGVVQVLTKKGHIEQQAVMAEIRAIDDENENLRVEDMKRLGIIEKSSGTIDGSSLVVTTQTLLKTDGKSVLFSNFRTYEMPDQQMEPWLAQELLGKKAGDAFEYTLPSKDILITKIKAVYGPKQRGGVKVEAPAPEATPATETPAQPDSSPAPAADAAQQP